MRREAFSTTFRATESTIVHLRILSNEGRSPGADYLTLTVVASLMSFDELPIISFTGSASTLN